MNECLQYLLNKPTFETTYTYIMYKNFLCGMRCLSGYILNSSRKEVLASRKVIACRSVMIAGDLPFKENFSLHFIFSHYSLVAFSQIVNGEDW